MELRDIYRLRRPLSWRHVWRRVPEPTALELASADLEQCRVDRLEHQREAEYHKAMTAMLEQRERRLQADIAKLSGPQSLQDE